MQHLRIDSVTPVAEGYVLIKDVTGGVSVQIDVDGARGAKGCEAAADAQGADGQTDCSGPRLRPGVSCFSGRRMRFMRRPGTPWVKVFAPVLKT